MILCYDLSEKIAVIYLDAVAMLCENGSHIYLMKNSINFLSTDLPSSPESSLRDV